MLRIVSGNVLEADVDAVVNTVNTVGVMGKGIALAFRAAYPENYRLYVAACKADDVRIGQMFVTENRSLHGPRWIINFPTKRHWRHRSKLDWIREGLGDLRQVVLQNGVRTLAVPPLGCGHGGLDWNDVRPAIESALADLPETDVLLFEPTTAYLTPVKTKGATRLTPARALIADAIRRYSVLGIECFNLEAQKLAYFVERAVLEARLQNPLQLQFRAGRYGPYSDTLRHVLDSLDGTWLGSQKRLADSGPFDRLWFDFSKEGQLDAYLRDEMAEYGGAVAQLDETIDGFESPLGMELLATVDWLLRWENATPSVEGIRSALGTWPGGTGSAERKQRLFDDRMLEMALERLPASSAVTS